MYNNDASDSSAISMYYFVGDRDKLEVESITVMVQKEVADRLTAIPGSKNAGAITYPVCYYCEAKEVLLVPNTSFIPAPQVNSEVIKLSIRATLPVQLKDETLFFYR